MITMTSLPGLSSRIILLCISYSILLLTSGFQTPTEQPSDDSVISEAQLERQAGEGNVEAILSLLKLSRTDKQRRHWLLRAAELNHVASQYALYELLIQIDDADSQRQAYGWLKRAAQNHSMMAQFSLGEFYLSGAAEQFGIIKDPHRASLWLNKAADQGHFRAHEMLASYLAYGREGMQLDFNKSRYHYQWLIDYLDKYSATLNYPEDKVEEYRQGLQRVIQFENRLYHGTFEQRRTMALDIFDRSKPQLRIHAHSLALLTELAREGDADTQYELARIYALGRFKVPADAEQAVYWYQRAAQQSHIAAMQDLMNAYTTGAHGIARHLLKARQLAQQLYDYQRNGQHGLVSDPALIEQRKKEVEYYDRFIEIAGGTFVPEEELEQRAQKGDVAARYQLARQLLSFQRHERGKEAYQWMKRAAEGEHADANFQMYRYYDGHGFALPSGDNQLTKDEKQRLALYYLKRAVDIGHTEAIYMMANAYEKGNYGLILDYYKAKSLYQQVVAANKEGLSDATKASQLHKLAQSRIIIMNKMIRHDETGSRQATP